MSGTTTGVGSGTANLGVARHVVCWICLVAFAFCALLAVQTRQEKEAVHQIPQSIQARNKSASNGENVNNAMIPVSSGTAGDVPYYSCNGILVGAADPDHTESLPHSTSSSTSSTTSSIVLLHGARFTKEDWKSSGIMQQFCNTGHLAVIALDLPVQSTHAVLQETLQALAVQQQITLPVNGLVTPSASGLSVVDWLENGNVQELFDSYVSLWIPVAPPSINRASEEALRALIGKPVLAIYGNQDAGGKRVSERLESVAGATKVELEGGHPCYLDSPDAFVDTVLAHLRIQGP